MVKGISKQVILLQSPDKELFEQAIFILRDDAVGRKGVTDSQLLQEARRIMSGRAKGKLNWRYCLFWAGIGAVFTGILWLASALL